MDQPKLITTPFAQDAPSGAVDPIPETLAPSDPIQNASWTLGFPNVTMIPLAAGGIPPRGQSMNGVLKAISEHSSFVGGGGQYKWDQDWVDAKGGYAKGAVLQSDDGLASYVSAVDNNTDNFNTDPDSIGTSWLPYSGAVKIDSAGTGLIQDGTALRVNFGTTAGTVMQGNDSRIVNALQRGNNLSDVSNTTTARSNLGLGTAATRDATTSSADTTAGRLMVLGTWGFGGVSPRDNSVHADDLLPGQRRTWSSQFTEADAVAAGLPALGGSPNTQRHWNVEAVGISNRVVQYASEVFGQGGTTRGRTFIRVKHDATWYPWEEVCTTGNLLQTTGSSTEYPMSQKAVTDALGQPSMTGTATLNGSIDNTVELTDIVTTLALEVGDVIRIAYTGYDKLHSVESITNNDSIIVNYEHAGNRANGSLKLADQSATVTITRIAKWYNAPLGLGQAWVDVMSNRSSGVYYTNSTNRIMSVFRMTSGSDSSISLSPDGGTTSLPTASEGQQTSPFSYQVPSGWSYKSNGGGMFLLFWELR